MNQPIIVPPPTPQRSIVIAYVLWLFGLFGVCGLHRIYVGKPVSGVLSMFTMGFFLIGQIIDVFLIPSMVDEFNFRKWMLSGYRAASSLGSYPATVVETASAVQPRKPLKGQALMREIMKLAQANYGTLTIPQTIVAIEADFNDIEKAFKELQVRNYAQMETNFKTGAIEYRFIHLEPPNTSSSRESW